MIHQPTAQIIQLHRRLGSAKLMHRLWRYSIGQSLEALTDLICESPANIPAGIVALADKYCNQNIGILTWLDLEYPTCLRTLESEAPPLLYVLGDTARLTMRSIAVIGTRRPSLNGKIAATNAAIAAVKDDWVVVSGNASGVDCAAHNAAVLEPTGQTLVFPPCPLDEYKQRFPTKAPDRITVASPFVPGSQVQPWMFLHRNSLVAAHCSAAIVAETGVSGGTLDTVKKLATHHRPIFATELPWNSRFASAHTMLAAGGIPLLPFEDEPDAAMNQVLTAAAQTPRHPPVKTAVLNDLFGEEFSL